MAYPAGFDKELALFLGRCCIETYTQLKYNGCCNVPEGFRRKAAFKAVPVLVPEWFGYMIESADAVVIAFRGSLANPDWLANAAVFQVTYPYTPLELKTHAGFTGIYSSCRKQIMDALQCVSTEKQLYITGHSLGGALAILCALDIAVNTSFRHPVMYSFGSPRVGDQRFAYLYNVVVSDSFRIVIGGDVVATLPPVALTPPLSKEAWYFEHVKSELRLEQQGGRLPDNHLMEGYLKALVQLDAAANE